MMEHHNDLPSTHEYMVNGTLYKVISIFSDKGTLEELYKKYMIDSIKNNTVLDTDSAVTE